MRISLPFAVLLASHLSSAANIHRNAARDQGVIGLNPINNLPVASEGRTDAGKLRVLHKKHASGRSTKHSKKKNAQVGRARKHSGQGQHHLGLGKDPGHSRHNGTHHGKPKRPHSGQAPGAGRKPKGNQSEAPSSSLSVPPVATTPVPAPAQSSLPAPSPTQPSGGGGGGGGGGSDGQTYTGDITYYTPGMGSCGITNTESDSIVALAEDMMAPMDGGNPNNNPYCGRSITISYNGKTAQATIEDKCPGCAGPGLDLTPSLFQQFADLGQGRVSGVQWWFN